MGAVVLALMAHHPGRVTVAAATSTDISFAIAVTEPPTSSPPLDTTPLVGSTHRAAQPMVLFEWPTAFYMSTMSPDGSHLAVTLDTYADATQRVRIAREIVVVDTDPATLDEPSGITDAGLIADHPRWHPSDDRILFTSFDPDAPFGGEDPQLYTVSSDGSDLAPITRDDGSTLGPPMSASWTPDGERIIASIGVVSGDRLIPTIAYVDPASGEMTETTLAGTMPVLQP